MTDCALAAPTRPGRGVTRVNRLLRRPSGIPRWTRLFGVAVVPLEQEDPDAPQAWVVCAGAGTAHTAALFHEGPYAGHRLH
ncbi:MAG TPA: hypothetical protein VGK78_03485 [Nocardioides sp.]|uniref:hypothetical protein n=1 Tax=Nocardioides sp. TaxID=35761 RepID=UPI002F3FBC37